MNIIILFKEPEPGAGAGADFEICLEPEPENQKRTGSGNAEHKDNCNISLREHMNSIQTADLFCLIVPITLNSLHDLRDAVMFTLRREHLCGLCPSSWWHTCPAARCRSWR